VYRIFRNTILVTICVFLVALPGFSELREESFNRRWRFAVGEQPEDVVQPAFDDSSWETVDVPHDWAIAGPFNKEENGYAAKLPWRGVGWYRKTFELKKADKGKRVYFDFDGVMAHPKVYINGKFAGGWNYGYVPFRVDATPFLKYGATNTIVVQADTRRHGTRWYPGAGIYRKVTMTVCHPVHIAHWGISITTPDVNGDSATIAIKTTVENHLESESAVDLTVRLSDPDGMQVALDTIDGVVPAGGSYVFSQNIVLTGIERWDVENPALYIARVSLTKGNALLSTTDTSFGIRTFRFDADDGFFLNGRRVQLYGVNNHHDQGPLGAAFYKRAGERQLEILKDMGINALRTSHNPPAAEILDLCDRMGILVWDECFDKWDDKADRIDGQPPLIENGERQLRNLILRDRNHPSVVVWSIGNEIPEGGKDGLNADRVSHFIDFCNQLDPMRPAGLGHHIPGTADSDTLASLDVCGYNYMRRYANFRVKFPNIPIVYSESASALSERGFYDPDLAVDKVDYSANTRISSYDMNAAAWSDIPDREFRLMEEDSFVAGEFVWTGFDYLGEPTPYSQEARSSYFGIVDLCGIPKDRFYLYRSYWRPDTTTIHLLPHWNWQGREGDKIPVFLYTNGDSAELFLNGKSLGKRVKGRRPRRPADLAKGKRATAGSTMGEHHPANATDVLTDSRWCAANANPTQWWQVDLGNTQTVRCVVIDFEKEARRYGYQILASTDGDDWITIKTKPTSNFPRWGGPTRALHDVEASARYIRIAFNDLKPGTLASLHKCSVYPEPVENDYYDVTYDYRLRWNDVIYEPGELRAVAYKDGKRIGETIMCTAGPPARIRLTPDRTELDATGEDLSYILVEALDNDGTLCPLADDLIQFEVEGPGDIAGVGNGNPRSYEPFQADHRKLFYGKAMLIVRTQDGVSGTVRVTATGQGLESGSCVMNVR